MKDRPRHEITDEADQRSMLFVAAMQEMYEGKDVTHEVFERLNTMRHYCAVRQHTAECRQDRALFCMIMDFLSLFHGCILHQIQREKLSKDLLSIN